MRTTTAMKMKMTVKRTAVKEKARVLSDEVDERAERGRDYEWVQSSKPKTRRNPQRNFTRGLSIGYRPYVHHYPLQRKKGPTNDQAAKENARRLLHGKVHELDIKEGNDSDDSDKDADDNEEEEPLESEENRDTSASEGNKVVYINARGNLCDDLPLLPLSSRQILCEMWDAIYPHQTTRYKATIRNLDFFPFFRFCQMLGKSSSGFNIFSVTGNIVDIEFDTVFCIKDQDLHRITFRHVKRLIELRRYQGFPLRGVVTGLSPNEDNPRNPFTDFMYSVRQIVALWRLDIDQWRLRSTENVAKGFRIEESSAGTTTKYWRQRTDLVIVKATTDMLVNAAVYRLGYQGSWSPVGRDKSEWHEDHMDMFRFRGKQRKIAYQKEHATVYMTDAYCEEVDERLRHVLGDQYAEWELLPDSQGIPQDMLL